MDEYPSGYGRLAAFEDCDPGFLISRKFGWLHTRLWLHLQDDIQRLETELERLDNWQSLKGDPKVLRSNGLDRSSPSSKRQILLAKIKEKLAEYGRMTLQKSHPLRADIIADELMFCMQRLQAVGKPSKQHQNAVYGMVTQNIPGSETLWMRRVDDLAALASGAEHGWFNVFLEKMLNKISRRALLVRTTISIYQ